MAATTPKGQRAVSRILDAAEVVVGRDGHGAATLRAIAAEGRVDKRVLSYYFASREALLAEVVGRAADRVATQVDESLGALDAGARTPRAVLDVVWEGIMSEPALVRTYVAIIGARGADARVAEVTAGMDRRYTTLVRDALRELGHSSSSATRLAAVALVAVRGLLLTWAADGEMTVVGDTLELVSRGLETG